MSRKVLKERIRGLSRKELAALLWIIFAMLAPELKRGKGKVSLARAGKKDKPKKKGKKKKRGKSKKKGKGSRVSFTTKDGRKVSFMARG